MDEKVRKLTQLLGFPEQSPIPFAVYQFVEGRVEVVLVSKELCRMANMNREDMLLYLRTNMYAGVYPEDAVKIASSAYIFATQEGDYDVIYRENLKGYDELQIIHAVGKHVYLDDGERYAVVTYENVSKASSASSAMNQIYVNAIKDFYEEDEKAVCVVTKDTCVVLYANKRYMEIIPPRRDFDSGLTYWDYFYKEPHPEIRDYLAELCGKGDQLAETVENSKLLVLRVREVEWSGIMAYVICVEEQSRIYRDELTHLSNQTYFDLAAEDAITRITSEGRAAVCLFYDIVGMRLYNKQNGFSAGDALLLSVSEVLKEAYPDALISRFDNDHFCLISPEEELREKVEHVEKEVLLLGGGSKIELKVGISRIDPGKGQTISEICDQARIAGESIKSDPDKCYCIYDEAFEKELAERKVITERLDYAIANGEIKVFYQPIIRTLTGQLCGYEALARWISPELGFLSPGVFIPALEEARLIHKLDACMIRQICRELKEYIQISDIPPVPVSFNLSRLDFMLCDIFQIVEDAVGENSLDKTMINIEITESLLVEDALIREEIKRFHDAGYKVWMDDFGSGYSSLNTLKDYEFDKLKIDMLFLSSFTQKSKDIIASIVQMAKRIGIRTLAEGCETAEQYEFLKGVGCEEVQGYYFGKPMPGRDCIREIYEKKFIPEKVWDRELYQEAGRTFFHDDSPMAIIDYMDDTFFLLHENRASQRLMEHLQVTSHKVVEVLNRRDSMYFNLFHRKLNECIRSGRPIRFSFSYHDTYLSVTVGIIAEKGDHLVCKFEMFDTQVAIRHLSPRSWHLDPDHKRTILIADDEPVNCMILGEMLKEHYNILYAEDGQQALDKIFTDPEGISAVVLDMVMPKMDGMQVLYQIRTCEQTRFLPVIAMTSATDLEIDLLHSGVNQFFSKPLEDRDLILAKIENVIRNARGQ